MLDRRRFQGILQRLEVLRKWKELPKKIYRMSLAMGLEPLSRPAGPMAFPDVCHGIEKRPRNNAWWIFAAVVLFTCAFTVCFLHGNVWTKECWKQKLQLEVCKRTWFQQNNSWADHYEFAAGLEERLDSAEELHEILATRTTIFEEQAMENFSSNEEFMDCVRYGLMEIRGVYLKPNPQ